MSYNGHMPAIEPSSNANADQPEFLQFLVGMDHNFQDDSFAEGVNQSQPVDPALLDQQPQLQAQADYSTNHNFLAAGQAFQSQDLFNVSGFDLSQSINDIPLNSEPSYVPRNIIESYTPGDRTTTSPLFTFENWTAPMPFVPQALYIQPTEPVEPVQPAQQPLLEDSNEVPQQGLRRPPTWAQVASLPSANNRLKPTPVEGVDKGIQISMRRGPTAPSVSMLSRPSDVHSIMSTSTTRTGKRKRSPGPSDVLVTCDHAGCGRTFKDTSALNHHRKNHTKTEDRPFKCKVKDCEYAFLWKKDLVRHETMHSKKKPFVCKVIVAGIICDKAFSRHDNLRRHHNSAHPNLPCPSTNGSSQP